jgi:hypothetical protein
LSRVLQGEAAGGDDPASFFLMVDYISRESEIDRSDDRSIDRSIASLFRQQGHSNRSQSHSCAPKRESYGKN